MKPDDRIADGVELAGQTPLLDVLDRPHVQRIYVHDNAAVAVPSLRAAHGDSGGRYAERAMLLARPGDVVVVERPLEAAYLAYLDRLGLGPGSASVLAVTDASPTASTPAALDLLDLLMAGDGIERIARRLRPDAQIRLSSYYASAAVHRLATVLAQRCGREVIVEGGTAAAITAANCKDLVRTEALRIGVPWPDGEFVTWPAGAPPEASTALVMAAIERVRRITGAVFLRGVWSARGIDNLKVCADSAPAAVAAWLAQRPDQRGYLVEAFLPVHASPNVQVWIEDDGDARVLSVTGQRLTSSLEYEGNLHPHVSDQTGTILQSSLRMSRRLGELGYRGLLGLDFIEVGTEAATSHRLVEVNGRMNGATYGVAVAERLNQRRRERGLEPLTAWRTAVARCASARSFAGYARQVGDLLYAGPGAEPAGIVPFNCGCLPHGYTYLLSLAGTAGQAQRLERAAIARTA